jgi:hypothetical protein
VTVAGIEVGDDDLDAFLVLAPVGFDTQIAGKTPIDGHLGLAHALGQLFVQAPGAEDVDQLDPRGEANA